MPAKTSKRLRAVCATCKKEFLYYPSTTPGKYCSNRCYHDRPRTLEACFWERVTKTESCWIWKGALVGGYGQLMVGHKRYKSNRLAWMLLRGPIPDGMLVCHDCPGGDRKDCVNPDHLWLGTTQDNSRDAAEKGQVVRGEAFWSAKLTPEQVRLARRAWMDGGNLPKLAQEFGVCYHTLWQAARRYSWRHVE
jgi:hypothetical protein